MVVPYVQGASWRRGGQFHWHLNATAQLPDSKGHLQPPPLKSCCLKRVQLHRDPGHEKRQVCHWWKKVSSRKARIYCCLFGSMPGNIQGLAFPQRLRFFIAGPFDSKASMHAFCSNPGWPTINTTRQSWRAKSGNSSRGVFCKPPCLSSRLMSYVWCSVRFQTLSSLPHLSAGYESLSVVHAKKSPVTVAVHGILLSTISVHCVRQYFVSELLTYKTQCVLMITVLDQGWRDLNSIPTPPSKLSEWPWGRSVRSSLIGSTSAEGEDIQSSSSWSQQLHSSAAGEKKMLGQ